jgi:hypothetical protein
MKCSNLLCDNEIDVVESDTFVLCEECNRVK